MNTTLFSLHIPLECNFWVFLHFIAKYLGDYLLSNKITLTFDVLFVTCLGLAPSRFDLVTILKLDIFLQRVFPFCYFVLPQCQFLFKFFENLTGLCFVRWVIVSQISIVYCIKLIHFVKCFADYINLSKFIVNWTQYQISRFL